MVYHPEKEVIKSYACPSLYCNCKYIINFKPGLSQSRYKARVAEAQTGPLPQPSSRTALRWNLPQKNIVAPLVHGSATPRTYRKIAQGIIPRQSIGYKEIVKVRTWTRSWRRRPSACAGDLANKQLASGSSARSPTRCAVAAHPTRTRRPLC